MSASERVHPSGPPLESLFDLAAGRLHPDAAAWLEQHISACADCGRTWNRIRAVRQTLEVPAELPFRRQRDLTAVRRRLEHGSPRRGRRWIAAGMVGVAACGFLLALWYRRPQPGTGPPPVRCPSLTILGRQGAGQLTSAGRALPLLPGLQVAPGGMVALQPSSRVVGQWAEARVLLEGDQHGALVRLDAGPAGERRLMLESGRVSLDVDPLPAGATLAVVTSDGRVTVHGTRFLVDQSGQGIIVAVDRGLVRVHSRGGTVDVAAGSRLSAAGVEPLKADEIASLEASSSWLAGGERARSTLEVLADVPAADVSVDGVAVGRTPLVMAIAPGAHRVRVSAPGRLPVEEQVEVASEAPATMRAELRSIFDEEAGSVPQTGRTEPLERARQLVLAGSYRRAIAFLERVRSGGPATVRTRAALLEAQTLRLEHRPAEALPLLVAVARGRGHEAEQAHYLLGQTFARDLSDPARASSAWSIALQRFPQGMFREEELYRLGESLLAAHDGGRGLDPLERYLAQFPRGAHSEDAHLLVAAARRDRMNDCRGALPHFAAVANGGGPRATQALIGQARCLRALGRRDEAREAYLRYLEVAPRGRFADEARAQR